MSGRGPHAACRPPLGGIQRGNQGLMDPRRLALGGRLVPHCEAKRELVTPKARSGVIRANRRCKRLGHDPQHVIASRMPMSIVHRLKVIEIDDAAQENPIVTRGRQFQPSAFVCERPSVAKARKMVGLCAGPLPVKGPAERSNEQNDEDNGKHPHASVPGGCCGRHGARLGREAIAEPVKIQRRQYRYRPRSQARRPAQAPSGEARGSR